MSITCWFQAHLRTSRAVFAVKDAVPQLEATSHGRPWARYYLQLELHIRNCEIRHPVENKEDTRPRCWSSARSGRWSRGRRVHRPHGFRGRKGRSPGRTPAALWSTNLNATLSEQHQISQELLLPRATWADRAAVGLMGQASLSRVTEGEMG